MNQGPTGATGPTGQQKYNRNNAMQQGFQQLYGQKGPVGPIRGMTVPRRRG